MEKALSGKAVTRPSPTLEQAPSHLLDYDTCYLEHDKQKQGKELKHLVVKVMGCGQVIKTEPDYQWILVFKKIQKSPYQVWRGKVKLQGRLPVVPWSHGPERERRKTIVIVCTLCAKDCYLISEQILSSLLLRRRFVPGLDPGQCCHLSLILSLLVF